MICNCARNIGEYSLFNSVVTTTDVRMIDALVLAALWADCIKCGALRGETNGIVFHNCTSIFGAQRWKYTLRIR